jgi:DNA helicase II / ATP-dependent DNA helicase PcrA
MTMEYLKSLNSAQKEAVLQTEGPVLVLAGAGAGKTRTIAHRIVHLVNSGVSSQNILAITFTNKAAKEMRERVNSLLSQYCSGRNYSRTTVSTFHAFCVIMLRKYFEHLPVHKHFTIYDRNDSLRAIKRAIKLAEEDEKQFEPRLILSAISKAKGDTKTLNIYREEAGNSYFPIVVSKVWEHYEKILRKDNAFDFDDLLLEMWKLLSRKEAVKTELANMFTYIHVDEYQDTNKVQYEIVRLLAEGHNNIFCVGDLDQNIYSWRGSTIENILEFEKTFRDAKIILLEENYRSTKNIIAVSNDIIKKNKNRKKKTLFTNNPEGEKISILIGYDERDEAESIAGTVSDLIEHTEIRPENVAILYRANFQSRVLEESFLNANIPYKVLGTRFFDRKEVKDILSYIRVALNPESEVDIQRTINTPLRGIGKITVSKLLSEGRNALQGKTAEKVSQYFTILKDIQTKAQTQKASEVLTYTLSRSGIEESLKGKGEEEEERLQNIKELVSLAAVRYDEESAPNGLLRLIEDAALATDQDELDQNTQKEQNGVTLMTIHAAKGLEYSHVFISGLEDGLFPHERSESVLGSAVDTEEERRLFYVALTRAKEKLYLSYAQMRTVFGQRLPRLPSEFLLDVDESFVEKSESPIPSSQEKGPIIYLD